jgi:dTDP-4-dehydrorhamnose reductase
MRLVVLVTGASGQLVKPYIILQRNAEIDFVFLQFKTLDVTDKAAIKSQFEKHQPNFVSMQLHILRLIKQSKNPKSNCN